MKRIATILLILLSLQGFAQVTSVKPVDLTGRGTTFHDLDSLMLVYNGTFNTATLSNLWTSYLKAKADAIYATQAAASDSLYFDSTSIIGTGSATNPLRSNPEYKIFHALDSSWWKLYVDSSHALRLVQYYPGFNATPNPPTSAVISDAANTFDFTYSTTTGFGTFSKYEYSVDGGLTYQPLTAKPLNVGDNAYAIGVVQIRAKAGPGTNASSSLTNPSAFTVTASNVNVLTNSENFFTANPPFTGFNVTGTHTGDADPIGGTAASFFQLSGTTGASVEYRGDTSVTGTTYTLSLYCQPASPLTTYNLWVGDGSFTKQCESNFDLSTTSGSATIVPGGAVSAPTSSVSPVAGHLGWYRVSLTWTAVSSYNAGYFYLGTANGTAGNTGHIFGLMKNTGSAAGTYQRKP